VIVDKIPFSVYDFFAYLASGIVAIAGADYVLDFGLTTARITPVQAALLVVAAYVSGHVVAQFSSLFFERLFVDRFLGRPVELLLGARPRWVGLKWLFPNYFRSLPEQTRSRVLREARLRGLDGTGEALFLHAYSCVSENPNMQARLDGFRNQYGFARNMSLALLTSAAFIVAARLFWHRPVRLALAAVAVAASGALFYRYLKFFRQFSYELLLRYAELGDCNSMRSDVSARAERIV
jgi:hypothetical protein